MKPENYIKRIISKNSNAMFFSLIYIKRHNVLYYFDIIDSDKDFVIKILNQSKYTTLIDTIKNMFYFDHPIYEECDYQEIHLKNKLNVETCEKIGIPVLGIKKINNKQTCIFVNNYYNGEILKV